jgi:hypothetical protein
LPIIEVTMNKQGPKITLNNLMNTLSVTKI